MQSNVMEYLQVFFRRRNLFIYPFILTVFVVVVLSFILPKTYVSSAIVLIEDEKLINPLISGLAVSTSVAERMRVLQEQILSWNSLAELVRRLKMDVDVKSPLGFEQLIKDLQKNIIVNLKGPQVITISYQGRQPEQVQLIAKTLTEIFIQHNMQAQVKETDVAVKFLEDQLRFYRRKIKEDEIKRMQEQLDSLLIDSTEKHPLVQDLRLRISRLKEDLERDTGDVKVTYKATPYDKDFISYLIYKELKKDTKQEEGEVVSESLPGEESFINTDTRAGLPLDAKVNQDIYWMLLNRLETARISKELEGFKEGARFTILEPARLPLKPVKPKKIQFLLLGIALGVAVGYGAIYLAELVDQSFKNIHEAQSNLGGPILGAISVIITEDEFNKKKQSSNFTFSLTMIFLALMVVIVLIASYIR